MVRKSRRRDFPTTRWPASFRDRPLRGLCARLFALPAPPHPPVPPALRLAGVTDSRREPGPVLLVGYGSGLLGDDAAGRRVVEELELERASVPALRGAKFVLAECLVPELALEVAGAGLALFADAASDGRPPGEVRLERLDGSSGRPASIGCWQDLSPQALLSLARELYGNAPAALLLSVGVASRGLGEGLSPEVEAAVPRAVAAARTAISVWATAAPPRPSSPSQVTSIFTAARP